MISSLMLAAALSCPKVILVNFPSPLTTYDKEMISNAKEGCRTKHPNAPCLKSMKKTGKYSFWALCGKP